MSVRRGVILGVLFTAAALTPGTRAEDEPPVEATVYYSKEDPNWKKADDIIENVARKYPRVRVNRVSIDDEYGYNQLHAAETNLHIKNTGEITLVIGPLYLTSKGQRRDIEEYFESMTRRLLGKDDVKSLLPADWKAYGKEIFGKDAEVQAEPDNPNDSVGLMRVSKGGRPSGWIVSGFYHIACPVCSDVQFMMALDDKLTILDLRPVRELERLARALPEKERDAFTGQFKGWTANGQERRVDGISGATKTSTTYQTAVNEILKEIKKRAGTQNARK